MKNYIETKIVKNGSARMIVCVAFIFSLLISAAFRQSGTAAVSAQLSNDAQDSPQSNVQTFFNSSTIMITNNTTSPTPASLYPSTITVSGVNPALVTKVRVNLTGIEHTYPDDLDIILVGPQGQRAILMSDAGIDVDLNNTTLQFDQGAANALPDDSAITTGTYRPANYANYTTNDPIDGFPAPGPGALTAAPADLSVFNGTNPNGEWKLYVVDDETGDVGTISAGWTLLLTVPQVFTVTNANDSGAGSLRAAITAAQNGDLINFNFPILQTIELQSALPDITRSITIQGPGAGLLTVRRAANAPNFRIFSIPSGITNGVAISGMTISGGNRSDDFGGGIDSESDLTLTNVHITGNTAGIGGGVALTLANGTFTNCTFNNNSSTFANIGGGGIFFAGDGNRRILRVVNSTISGNSSAGDGGGIRNSSNFGDNSRLEVVNSTIAGNTAQNGGGIKTFTVSASSTATTTLRNTIVAGNTPTNLATSTTGATFQTLGFNLSNDFNGVFTPAATDITTTTPRLAPLAFYRGPTPTHALLFGSPAIDAGNNSGLTTDQTGSNRTVDLPSIPNANGSDGTDIGAFEAQTAPAAPQFTITDVLQSEGNAGTTNFIFTVSVINPNGQPVSVNYQTENGTATAPGDYTAVGATTLNFAPGETSKQAIISVNGDPIPEPDEFFNVNLSNPVGAEILDNQGRGTITNDDGSCTYNLSPASPQNIPATTSNLNVNITTANVCTWSATTSAGWISIINDSGLGSGTVHLFFAANTGPARAGSLTIAGQTYNINQAAGTTGVVRAPFDFDGDNKTDISIFRPSSGEWWYSRSSDGGNLALQFGTSGDKIVPADYTGDGKTDVAFWRPSTGQWFILRSEDLTFYAFPFGANGDVPVPADYDGDGKADPAVFRTTGLTWFINKSSGGTDIISFGAAGDKPVVADYDGDRKADIAIYRPVGTNGSEWWIRRSTNGSVFATQFGISTDKPVQGDYTGDGKADIAFFRPSTASWFILRSEDLSFYAAPFGVSTDVPVPGDYDGDGKFDLAVFRPAETNWFALRSSNQNVFAQQFGATSDKPVASAFIP